MASTIIAGNPSKKPRVVFGVTTQMSLRLLGEMPKFFAEKGWEVCVVCDSFENSFPHSFPEEVTLRAIKMSRGPSVFQDFLAFREWLAFLRSYRPDVISVGTPKAAALGILASWLARVRVRIYHLRGLRLESSEAPLKGVLYLIEALTAYLSTHVLAVSQSLRSEYIRRRLAPAGKVTVVGNGSSHGVRTRSESFSFAPIQPTTLEKLELARKENRPVIGFAGRFSEDKGSSAIRPLREALFRSGVDHDFAIIGPVEDSFNLLDPRTMTIPRRPIVVGEVAEIWPYLPFLSLVVLPTLREGFPNVVLEAAIMSVPTVITGVTGAIDSVLHGVTGLVVPRRDDEALAAAVMTLLRNAELLEAMGTAARKNVLTRYSSKSVNQAHFEFFTNALSHG